MRLYSQISYLLTLYSNEQLVQSFAQLDKAVKLITSWEFFMKSLNNKINELLRTLLNETKQSNKWDAM